MGAQGSKPQPTSPDLGRRRFLRRGVAVGAALAAAGRAAAGRAQSPPAPDDPSKVLGDPIRPYGERSRFEQTVREKFPRSKTDEVAASTLTPLGETLGIITPSSLHFEVHRGGVPDIDPRKHRLLIHGMVDRPVILTVEEIQRLPPTSRVLFLECQGNSRLEWRVVLPRPSQVVPRPTNHRTRMGQTAEEGAARLPFLRESGRAGDSRLRHLLRAGGPLSHTGDGRGER